VIPVQQTSRQAYHELKEEGKITGRQELAFTTVREFYEEKGYWPTPKEVHAFLAVEKGHEMAQFEGPNLVKPRISELIADPEDDYPDLLEKEDESRKQEYIEELLDDYDSKQADPVKIRDYQSTLSEEEGEAAEIEKQKDDTGAEPAPEPRDEEPEDEVEIHYEVDGGSEVRTGPPEEAIKETSDLDSVKQLLEDKGLLDQYRGLLSQHGDFVFDPEEGEDESDSDSEENQQILIKDGKPAV